MIFGKSKKKNEKESVSNISQGRIKIRIYMRFGAEVRQRRAEFYADEVRDGYGNLVAISDNDKNFNQDVDFNQDNVYSAINSTMGISNLTKKDAIAKIEELINKYNKRIKAIEKHPELNKFANIWDEKRKLNELEIYKGYLYDRSENGAYFKLEEGLRVYEYESIGGFLVPIWHGIDNMIDYADKTSKQKITIQESKSLEDYFNSKKVQKIAINLVVILLVVNVVLFGANMFSGFKLYGKHGELDDQINACSIQAAQTTLTTVQVFNEVMRNPFILKQIEKMDAEENTTIKSTIKELIAVK